MLELAENLSKLHCRQLVPLSDHDIVHFRFKLMSVSSMCSHESKTSVTTDTLAGVKFS